MKTAVIFVNSESVLEVDTTRLNLENSQIYCADGGANYVHQMGIEPDVLIGDFDSVKPEVLNFYKEKHVNIIHDDDQNKTDLELAIEHAIKEGVQKIQLLGSLSGRSDQALGNFFILAHKTYRSVIIEAISQNEATSYLWAGENRELLKHQGERVSLVAAEDSLVSLKNFKWDLERASLEVGSGLGISNLILKDQAYIEVHEGAAFVVQSVLESETG